MKVSNFTLFVIFAPTTWGVPFLVFNLLSPEKKKKKLPASPETLLFPPPPLTRGLVARISSGATGKVEWNFRKSSGPSVGWRIELVVATQVGWIFRLSFSPTKLKQPWKIGKPQLSWVSWFSNFAFDPVVGWDEERDREMGSRNRFLFGGEGWCQKSFKILEGVDDSFKSHFQWMSGGDDWFVSVISRTGTWLEMIH